MLGNARDVGQLPLATSSNGTQTFALELDGGFPTVRVADTVGEQVRKSGWDPGRAYVMTGSPGLERKCSRATSPDQPHEW